MAELRSPSPAYDEQYYRTHCGPFPYSREDPRWQAIFHGVADRIILTLNPRKVLDAGCAVGMLVESFWDRGVQCFGMDVSEYAISQVRADIARYCRVASVVEPLETRFDLIVCIEVLEHVSPEDAERAISNFAAATDVILFSSSPTDVTEPTHVNVQPVASWIRAFGAHGFYPDVAYDASFIAPHAMLFRRQATAQHPEVTALFATLIEERVRTHEERQRIDAEFAKLRTGLDALRQSAALASDLRQLKAQHKQHELASARLRNDLRRSDSRITQIYESRIWRTLVGAGGLVEKFTGRHAPKRATATAGGGSGVESAAKDFGDDFVRIDLESPSRMSPVLSGSILNVSGWTVARSGIDRISVWLDGDGPHEATYPLMREDVIDRCPGIVQPQLSGFSWRRSASEIGPGSHQIRVQAQARSGRDLSVSTTFEVDERGVYEIWTDLHTLSQAELERLREDGRRFAYQPKISIVTPVYRTPKDYLERCAASVRNQVYENWEWVVVDDNSRDERVTRTLRSLESDSRVHTEQLPENEGIAGATNAALLKCQGEFVALLDHDDELAPDALYQVVRLLNEQRDLDVLYSDEDKLGPKGERREGFFKPDWSPHLLLSMNYVCHFLVCRRSLLDRVGGLRKGFDGSQDYDLILRLSEQTDRIRRVPHVLYHWRVHWGSTAMSTSQKPEASDAGRRALEAHLERIGARGTVEEVGVCRYRVRYAIDGAPEVAIIIPTGGSEKLKTALETVIDKTTYRNFRIVVVDNSRGDQVESWVRSFGNRGVRVEWVDRRRQEFNFSSLCNAGADHAGSSEYLLFLNDDTAVITPDWIESMLEYGQRTEVGAVGAQLIFPNETIQHAGVVTGIVGIAAHPFRGLEAQTPHYFSLSHSVRDCSAVTGACLLIRKSVFDQVGRFDEANLPTCFQDVDLCLKLVEQRSFVVYTPYAQLYHFESASKKSVARCEEIEYMERRWQRYLKNDPFYNPNLSRRSDAYELDIAAER